MTLCPIIPPYWQDETYWWKFYACGDPKDTKLEEAQLRPCKTLQFYWFSAFFLRPVCLCTPNLIWYASFGAIQWTTEREPGPGCFWWKEPRLVCRWWCRWSRLVGKIKSERTGAMVMEMVVVMRRRWWRGFSWNTDDLLLYGDYFFIGLVFSFAFFGLRGMVFIDISTLNIAIGKVTGFFWNSWLYWCKRNCGKPEPGLKGLRFPPCLSIEYKFVTL